MKYILISGATSGIGFETAKLFAEKGYNLAICGGKNQENLNKVLEELSVFQVQVLSYLGDIKNPEFVREMMNDIFSHFPHLDAVINNAGVSHVGLLTDMSVEELEHVIGVNLSALFYVCRLAIPSMTRRKKGRIINISSIWGDSGASCEVAYSASKGGVNSFTKALAKELAPSGIQVNAISFGAIQTRMNDNLSNEEKNAFEEKIPVGRYGTPKEAAMLIEQLLHTPDYLTGQIIRMDGGFL